MHRHEYPQQNKDTKKQERTHSRTLQPRAPRLPVRSTFNDAWRKESARQIGRKSEREMLPLQIKLRSSIFRQWRRDEGGVEGGRRDVSSECSMFLKREICINSGRWLAGEGVEGKESRERGGGKHEGCENKRCWDFVNTSIFHWYYWFLQEAQVENWEL